MPRSSLWFISASVEILFQSWGISMHQLELIGIVMRHVLVPMDRTVNQNRLMDLGWLVHGFSAHKLIAGLDIPTLVVRQRRLTMCSLMVAGG